MSNEPSVTTVSGTEAKSRAGQGLWSQHESMDRRASRPAGQGRRPLDSENL